MRIEEDIKLDFCDVLIRPKRSDAPSRYNVNLKRTFKFVNAKTNWTTVPIIAANMDTVGTMAMANALEPFGASVALHKHYADFELINFFKGSLNSFYTLGIKDEDLAKLQVVSKALEEHGIFIPRICLDVANGYTKFFVDKVKKIRESYPKAIIMAGNVATPDMVHELILGGADIVKIGIGPGSVCTTRIMTGCGYPQLSAIIECADAAHGIRGHICADGGCTTPGDVSKAFGAGADFVMLGGMLSGTDECEGDWEYYDYNGNNILPFDGREPNNYHKKVLTFYGMSSKAAMDKYSGGKAAYKASEGKIVKVPHKGPVKEVFEEILGGIRSTCTMVGTEELKDLSKCCTFVRVNRTHNTVYGQQ